MRSLRSIEPSWSMLSLTFHGGDAVIGIEILIVMPPDMSAP